MKNRTAGGLIHFPSPSLEEEGEARSSLCVCISHAHVGWNYLIPSRKNTDFHDIDFINSLVFEN